MTNAVPGQPHEIMFVGNARCYHTMDWYRNARRLCRPRRVRFATDLIESEGHVKLVTSEDDLVHLFNIDRLLLRQQSAFGNIWRNAVKTLMIPLQVYRLKRIAKRSDARVFHAHTMYYMYLCWLARLPFIGTPQGSEILVRPYRSAVYRYFAVRSLRAARHVTVDSVKMRDAIVALSGQTAVSVVQNGIDISTVQRYVEPGRPRDAVVSIRGFTPLYRIDRIVQARAASAAKPRLTFTYPFWEDNYKAQVPLETGDRDLGRVMPKTALYEILSSALLAISIPASDSSPRSVYEAIFSGCCVAVTPSDWIDALPACMRARLFLVDLDNPRWLDGALAFATATTREPYRPSTEALTVFDQAYAMKVVADAFY